MKKYPRILGITATLLLICGQAQAVLFDQADVIDQGRFSAGLAGELLLSNPSSDGIEARAKYGLAQNFNVEAILGTGSSYRRFRLGVADVISFFPDTEGQVGISLVSGLLFLRRFDHSVFQMHAGPMINKKFTDWSVPLIAYFGLPLVIELDSGRYYTGSTITAGAILDWPLFQVPVELGIGIGRMESYVSSGVMVKF